MANAKIMEEIEKYIAAGLTIIPIGKNKVPQIQGWQKYTNADCLSQEHLDKLKRAEAYGMVCNQNVEILDFDLKNSVEADLFSRFCNEVKQNDPNLLDKMVVQKTMNNGYHFIYKCSKVEGSLKLALRKATEEEGKTGAKSFTVIESRGIGSQILIAPSKGYAFKKRSILDIQTITEDERDLLFTIARSFNTFNDIILPSPKPEKQKKSIVGKSIWDIFNDTDEGLTVLENNGWKIVGEKGEDVLLKRAGATTAAHSAYYHRNSHLLVCFTSSTIFEPQRGYNNASIIHLLEGHNGDWAKTAEIIKSMGYEEEKIEQVKKQKPAIPQAEEIISDWKKYAADPFEHLQYFEDSKHGRIPKGLPTGSNELNQYFRFKRGNFVVANGMPNVGKSLIMWYLAVLSNMKHGWKWIICSKENPERTVMKKFMEFYFVKSIKYFTEEETQRGMRWLSDNFVFLQVNNSYTAKQFVEIGESIVKDIDMAGYLIDPFSSIRLAGNNKEGIYAHIEGFLDDFQLFSHTHKCGIWLSAHTNTNASRNRGADGFPIAPEAADSRYGDIFTAKADDMLTFHRIVQDKERFRLTQIHVRKIKDYESLGMVTDRDDPVILELKDNCRFVDKNNICLTTEYYYNQPVPKAEPKDFTETKSEMKANTNFDNPFPNETDAPF